MVVFIALHIADVVEQGCIGEDLARGQRLLSIQRSFVKPVQSKTRRLIEEAQREALIL